MRGGKRGTLARLGGCPALWLTVLEWKVPFWDGRDAPLHGGGFPLRTVKRESNGRKKKTIPEVR